MARNQRKYNTEYKVQAVKLSNEIGSSKAAVELGIPVDTLYGLILTISVDILTTFLPFGLRVVKPSLLQHKSALDSPVFLNESKRSFLSLCFPFTYPKEIRWKRR